MDNFWKKNKPKNELCLLGPNLSYFAIDNKLLLQSLLHDNSDIKLKVTVASISPNDTLNNAKLQFYGNNYLQKKKEVDDYFINLQNNFNSPNNKRVEYKTTPFIAMSIMIFDDRYMIVKPLQYKQPSSDRVAFYLRKKANKDLFNKFRSIHDYCCKQS
jgi:hypothetical protein